MLNVNKINVFYEKLEALHDVSLKIDKGECVGLIGSNGAGKTTLLNTIIGVLHPKSGTITFEAKQIEGYPPYRIIELGIALVPEVRAIFPLMSVMDHLLLGAQSSRKAWDSRYDTLERVFQLFPRLKERKDQRAETLSGGESQMLNIARALMLKPAFLLLDEPSLGLAPNLVLRIFNILHKLHEEGMTILLSEQHVHHALNLCDRGYVIENGRIVIGGSRSELLADDNVKKKYLGV
ncbi:MAG: ABC transporter ATP-binding protein [Thermoproteota archaeon]